MKIGIYPGSFNPFHVGHYSVALKAEKLFDKIILAKGHNLDKPETLSYNEDFNNLPFEKIYYDGSLSKMISNQICYNGICNDYFIVRGLRNGYDLAYEESLRKVVEDYLHNLARFVYIFCDREDEHVSSSMIRQLDSLGEDIEQYLVKGKV